MVENFGKFFKKKSLRQNFIFFQTVQLVFSIKVVLEYYLQNGTLRVALKFWVGIDM